MQKTSTRRAGMTGVALLAGLALAPPGFAQAAHHQSCQVFKGTDKAGLAITFEDHGTGYMLQRGKTLTRGELNTERGWKNDEDATLFILDWRGPESLQVRIVRQTGTRNLRYLGQGQQPLRRPVILRPVPGARCTLLASAAEPAP
ncbi:hypothetical protein GCM10019060_27260 [Novosphingobium pokkalii]|nr:hypothetical protein GCM10019060_27260 [Novosphingobium pokkalii]